MQAPASTTHDCRWKPVTCATWSATGASTSAMPSQPSLAGLMDVTRSGAGSESVRADGWRTAKPSSW